MSSERNKIGALWIGSSQWGGEQVVGLEDLLTGVTISQVDGGQGVNIFSSRSNIVNSIKESNHDMTTQRMDCRAVPEEEEGVEGEAS